MTATYCTGWNRFDPDEWLIMPSWWQRVLMVWRFRKEMRDL